MTAVLYQHGSTRSELPLPHNWSSIRSHTSGFSTSTPTTSYLRRKIIPLATSTLLQVSVPVQVQIPVPKTCLSTAQVPVPVPKVQVPVQVPLLGMQVQVPVPKMCLSTAQISVPVEGPSTRVPVLACKYKYHKMYLSKAQVPVPVQSTTRLLCFGGR